jgi:TolB-like protein/tetratricopeptide (TPR) repeat protein
MATESPVLRFASFELDVRSRELTRGDTRVRLQEQPFEILRMMLERPGDVVTREELARRLWPNGTFVDFEHSLNAAIKRLRAALGDTAGNPRFVETLPRRGYRFIAPLNAAARGASGLVDPAAMAERVRLAVLPFTNQSGEAGQEYFSDGLTDEMIAQLGRLARGRIGVIARWSSMAFKGSSRGAREIGEALRADYLLEGSVRREGDRVRISAWLVETAGETHLWTDTYDRHLTDCLGVQADVAARIARSLAMELVVDEGAGGRAASDPAAYQAYLKGRYHWNLEGHAGLGQAAAYFEEALRIDPNYAAAWASLARTMIARAEYYVTEPRPAYDAAERGAQRALELDPTLSDAHLALGDVRRMRHLDWRGAETSYAQAIALNPSSEAAHRVYGLLLAALGRGAEAEREARRAHTLDPLCLVVGTSRAWVNYLARDYHTAIEQCGVVVEMDQRFLPARRVLAASLQQSGHPVEATMQLEQALSVAGDDPVAIAWLAYARMAAGQHAAASAMAAELSRYAGPFYLSPYHLAIAQLGAGNPDAALTALDQAYETRDPALVNVGIEPRFESLHNEPRFRTLLQRLKLAG